MKNQRYLHGENMLARYERKKRVECTSLRKGFRVFYKGQYICDLLKVKSRKWRFSSFRESDKFEGLKLFLYCQTIMEFFTSKVAARQYLEELLTDYEAGRRVPF